MMNPSQFTKNLRKHEKLLLPIFPVIISLACVFIMILIIYPTTYSSANILPFFVLVKVAMLLNVYILLQEFHPTLRKNHRSGWFMLAVIIISCPRIIYHVILKFSQTEFTTEEFHSHFFSRIWQTRLKTRHKYSLLKSYNVVGTMLQLLS